MTSVGGKIYTPLGAWYHGTKFALEGMSDVLRIELHRCFPNRRRILDVAREQDQPTT